MLIRTHLAITLFFVLLFVNVVGYKFIFAFVALIATFIPDIDTKFSKLGKKKASRILQFFVKHRGITHSFSFLILITIFLVMFFPILAFGFFLGYGLHLFADSFTKSGIRPFYPFFGKTSGKIKTGSITEISLFVLFLFLDILMILYIL